MASEVELAVAAIEALTRQGKDVNLKSVTETVQKAVPGKAVSRDTFEKARDELAKLKKKGLLGADDEAPPPPVPVSSPTPYPPRPALREPFDDVLDLVEAAKALIAAAGGDKDKVIRLIKTL